MNKHARGALFGQAVGDALGTTLEFTKPGPFPWGPLLTGPHTTITGDGPFRLEPGQITDDTQMAAALHASIRATGDFNVFDAHQRYVRWLRCAFDVGGQTSESIRRGQRSTPILGGYETWLGRNRDAAGNGSLMRTSPIGVFYGDVTGKLIEASILDSAITHFDPRCLVSCACFNAAIGAVVTRLMPNDTLDRRVRLMFEAATTAIRHAEHFIRANFVATGFILPDLLERAIEAAIHDLSMARAADPNLYGNEGFGILKGGGFVRTAFRLAFWELAHAPSFEAGVVDAVNRGGDADTNGAIVGALLGAAHGEDEIPEQWKLLVLNALSRNTGPLGTEFHPKVFFAEAPNGISDTFHDPDMELMGR